MGESGCLFNTPRDANTSLVMLLNKLL